MSVHVVDLYFDGEWIRAELVWVSRLATLFMGHGGRTHSMTLRSCEKLVDKRWMRLVETHEVVDAVISTLLRKSPLELPAARLSEAALSGAD